MKIIVFITFLFISCACWAQDENPISPCVTEIFLPKSFSGNGDSVNDYFIPRMVGSPDTYEFKIYNRWGEIIFETLKVEEGWNGTFKNEAMNSDTYVWMIVFTCKGSEEEYKLNGHVTLIR